jgi:predicted DNA-binding transcriptional regulator AlpA
MLTTAQVALPTDDDVLLTSRQTADILGLAEVTLAQYRAAGDHPLKFIRLNHQVVRYRAGDIRQYLRERTVRPRVKRGGQA